MTSDAENGDDNTKQQLQQNDLLINENAPFDNAIMPTTNVEANIPSDVTSQPLIQPISPDANQTDSTLPTSNIQFSNSNPFLSETLPIPMPMLIILILSFLKT
jgi:hypothetical protein